jgi:hypothetical protein
MNYEAGQNPPRVVAPVEEEEEEEEEEDMNYDFNYLANFCFNLSHKSNFLIVLFCRFVRVFL